MTTSLDHQLVEQWKATVLSHDNAPGAMQSVERLAKDADMAKPIVYLVDTIPGFGNLGRINAAAIWKDKILLTKGILHSFDSADLQAPMDIRLEAVIAHEMLHCKQHGMQLTARFAPLLLMPVMGVLGYHFYHKANEKKTREEKHEALETQAQAAEASVAQENQAPADSWQKHIIVGGKYIAAAALGLGAGIMTTRGFSNYFEYRGDAFSKKLMKSGKPLADALLKLEGDTRALLQTEGLGEALQSPVLRQVIRILHAHPSTEKRIEALLR